MNKIAENDIRNLIARWYAGETTPSEEKVILDWFASAEEPLPSDLAEEKEIFTLLGEAKEEISVPEEVARRIEAGIEAEIGRKKLPIRKFFKPGIWWAAAGIAAVLAGSIYFSGRLDIEPELSGAMELATSSNEEAAKLDTITIGLASNMTIKEPEEPSARPRKLTRRASLVPNAAVLPSPERVDTLDNGYYLTAEEEAELAAHNYRIVDNEEEAADILRGIFGNLSEYLELADDQIRTTNLQFENELKESLEFTKLPDDKNPLYYIPYEILPI